MIYYVNHYLEGQVTNLALWIPFTGGHSSCAVFRKRGDVVGPLSHWPSLRYSVQPTVRFRLMSCDVSSLEFCYKIIFML